MFAILCLLLLVALSIAGIIQAFKGQYGMAMVATAFAALLFAPSVFQMIDYRVRDIDIEVRRDDDLVEVRNRGPIAFRHKASRSPYGGLIHRFRTVVETPSGPEQVGFSIWKIGKREYVDRRVICPSSPGPDGLRDMIDAEARGPHNTVQCSVPRSTLRFMSAESDGPATTIRCTITSNQTRVPCAMRIFHGRYWLNVSMWNVPPDNWRSVRDHVVAVIDQSFRIAE